MKNEKNEKNDKKLFVSWHYPPYLGGVPIHMYELATRLAQCGEDISVLTTDVVGNLSAAEHMDGVHVKRVPGYPRNADMFFAPAMYEIITRGGWKLVHVQGIHTFVAPVAMLAAIRSRIPFVVTFHSANHASMIRNRFRFAQWRVLKPLLQQAAHYIALSESEADYFRRVINKPASAFSIIPNGCDLPRPDSIGKDPSTTRILTVGRLDPIKGHDRLIAALPKIRNCIPNARLEIIGSGIGEPQLRQQVGQLGLSDCVTIRGVSPTARKEIARSMLEADLVAFMSASENNPIAAMEAISLGCSVLVTHTSGLARLADQQLARAIPLESTTDEIAEAIVRQVRCPFVPAQPDLFTWDKCVTNVKSIYTHVLHA